MDKEKINSIFKEPGNYGVRGNHYLWIEFKERFEKEDIKSSLEFKNFLLENFKKLTGKSIMKSETYNIENNRR